MILLPLKKTRKKIAWGDPSFSVSLMPNSIFRKLNLRVLRPTTSSLTLAGSSVKYPLGILVDVPINVDDFYVLGDVIILDIADDACTKIILGRPFLATAGCKIYVKRDN